MLQPIYDVIVFGGGTAGVTAAVQAGRSGANVLLVEKNGILGGTMTAGGIDAPAHFFAWGKQIISGIGWEIAEEVWKLTGQDPPGPEFTKDNPGPRHLSVDKNILACVCDNKVIESGVEILFHSMPGSLKYENNKWSAVICTKTGLMNTSAKIIVDATGDGNAAMIAGFELLSSDVVQPGTLSIRLSGYDPDSLDYEALREAASEAVTRGELKTTDIAWDGRGPEPFLRKLGKNGNHVRALHGETSPGRTAVELEARRAVLRMYLFLKRQPGLERLKIDEMAVETGIRETRRIRGKHEISVHEYEAGTVYPDAVCYAFYPVDEHLNDGKGINCRFLKDQVLPTIPLRAMLPAGSRQFITAGRCISSDREANAAVRVECPCMAMGQAAGAAAALCARSGIDPEELSMETLRDELKMNGAVVPPNLND
jgi:hypothetical protein